MRREGVLAEPQPGGERGGPGSEKGFHAWVQPGVKYEDQGGEEGVRAGGARVGSWPQAG